MRRLAAHWVWYKEVRSMHYIELDDEGRFVGVFPLREEIAGTAFYDGVLVPVPSRDVERVVDFALLLREWRTLTGRVAPGERVAVYRLGGIPLASAKLGADHGGSDGYVERL